MTAQPIETMLDNYDFSCVVPWMPLPWGIASDDWFGKELSSMIGWYKTALEQDGVTLEPKAARALRDAALTYRAKIMAAKAAKEESKQ